ncbi:uncharacterized protein EDB91DRAFT_1256743 [Suillus paluster]|uniref:uncharacterized protein n=1 Tax=Suillus paluster TaxID=48578 RepID=UPI001B86F4A5|nr:uncharacterized protein EDB91DRAFT_1256743 [Suillus paluster]KAG1720987.1 hypothetical protein EDB91DRAFT_1256743 [Suillus paluster]
MNPLCQLRQWSPEDISRLMKSKGIIQDVEGECSFKVYGQSRKGSNVAAHYRIPLHALNKRFGLYRKIVAHLDASSHHKAAHMRDMYLSIMAYMNDVRIAFMEDAAQSKDPLHGDFRSPALDYYLWLDHTSGGFHAEYREALEETHGVTFERLRNGTCSDILVFLDWRAYHNKECKEHDCCGALQGCGGGEDLQHLLHAVDASLDAPNAPVDPEAGTEPIGSTHSGHATAPMVAESVGADAPSNPFPPFPHPFDEDCRMLALRTLGRHARQMLVGGFGRWLPSHIAMRLREIQGFDHTESLDDLVTNGVLITARSHAEFLEIYGMAEMMAKCQDLLVDRGSMARFFSVVGHALYTTCQGSECSVEYGQDFVFSIGQPEHLHALTSSRNGSRVQCGAPTDVEKQDHPSDSGPKDEPQHGLAVDIKVDLTHVAPQDMRSFEEREVQTDLDIRDEPRVIHSNSHAPEPGRQADMIVDNLRPSMHQIPIDLQSNSALVRRPDEHDHRTYAVCSPIRRRVIHPLQQSCS